MCVKLLRFGVEAIEKSERQSPVVFVLGADVAFEHRIHIRPERLPADPNSRPNRQREIRMTQIPKRRDVLETLTYAPYRKQ